MPEEKPPQGPKPGETPADPSQKADEKSGEPSAESRLLSKPGSIEEARATGKAQPTSEEKVAAQTKPVPEVKPSEVKPSETAPAAPSAAAAAKPAAEAKPHEKPDKDARHRCRNGHAKDEVGWPCPQSARDIEI